MGLAQVNLKLWQQTYVQTRFLFCRCNSSYSRSELFATNNVAIDLRGRRLIDLNCCISFLADVEKESITFCGLTLNSATQFDRLLLKFLDILVPKFQATVNKHGVQHHIVTHGYPIFARPRRLPADKFSVAKDEFTKLEEAGIVR